MSNFFDQFDEGGQERESARAIPEPTSAPTPKPQTKSKPEGNFFDRFDGSAAASAPEPKRQAIPEQATQAQPFKPKPFQPPALIRGAIKAHKTVKDLKTALTPVPALAAATAEKGAGGAMMAAEEFVNPREFDNSTLYQQADELAMWGNQTPDYSTIPQRAVPEPQAEMLRKGAVKGRELYDEGKMVEAQIEKDNPLGKDQWFMRGLRSGASSAYVQAPLMLANPFLALGGMSTMSGGEEYAAKLDEGYSPREALSKAFAAGAAEYYTEKLPIDAAGKFAKGILAKTAVYAGGDVPGELLNNAINASIDRAMELRLKQGKDVSMKDLLETVMDDFEENGKETIVAALAQGGPVGLSHAIQQTNAENAENADQGGGGAGPAPGAPQGDNDARNQDILNQVSEQDPELAKFLGERLGIPMPDQEQGGDGVPPAGSAGAIPLPRDNPVQNGQVGEAVSNGASIDLSSGEVTDGNGESTETASSEAVEGAVNQEVNREEKVVDYDASKEGDTTTIYDSNGDPQKVKVLAVSGSGTRLVEMPDGTTTPVGVINSALDPRREGHVIESAGVGSQGKSVSELSDQELVDLGQALEAHPARGTNQGAGTNASHDLIAVRSEQGRRAEHAQKIDTAANEAATSQFNNRPEPTKGQMDAGTYKKGHVRVHGLDIAIENPAGSIRKDKETGGQKWQSQMAHHYGYIKRSRGITEGGKASKVDVFVGRNPGSQKVFVVDQQDPKTGKFDEHKVMLGFDSIEAAREGYLANYPQGWKGIGNITETTPDKLKSWLDKSGARKRPFNGKKNTSAGLTKISDNVNIVHKENDAQAMKSLEDKFASPENSDDRISKRNLRLTAALTSGRTDALLRAGFDVHETVWGRDDGSATIGTVISKNGVPAMVLSRTIADDGLHLNLSANILGPIDGNRPAVGGALEVIYAAESEFAKKYGLPLHVEAIHPATIAKTKQHYDLVETNDPLEATVFLGKTDRTMYRVNHKGSSSPGTDGAVYLSGLIEKRSEGNTYAELEQNTMEFDGGTGQSARAQGLRGARYLHKTEVRRIEAGRSDDAAPVSDGANGQPVLPGNQEPRTARGPRALRAEPGELNVGEAKVEYRANATQSDVQSGRQLLDGLDRRAKRNGSLLANAIATELKTTGTSYLLGKEVRSPGDLATLAQVYRNPSYETFRIVFIKDGKVVGHNGITSRLPGAAAAFVKGETMDQAFSRMRGQMKELGADSYYLLHNHPSGRVTASQADANMTGKFATELPGLQGHVVINHNRYFVLNYVGDGNLSGEEFERQFEGEIDPGKIPSVPHELLGARIAGHEDVVYLGKEMEVQSGSVLLISRSATGEVNGLMVVSLEEITGKRGPAIIRRFARQTGGADVVAALNDIKDLRSFEIGSKGVKAIEDNYLIDIVDMDGHSVRTAASTRAPDQTKAFGQKIVGRVVKEDVAAYEAAGVDHASTERESVADVSAADGTVVDRVAGAEAAAQVSSLNRGRIPEQTVVTIKEAQDWLEAHGFPRIAPQSATNRLIDELRKNDDFKQLNIFDQIRLAAQLERPIRKRDYNSNSLPKANRKLQGQQGGNVRAGENQKVAGSGVVAADTIRGCDHFCFECYALKGAAQGAISHQHPVMQTLSGTIKDGEILRLGETGDPSRNWAWTDIQVKKVIEASHKRGAKVTYDDVFYITKLLNLKGYNPETARNLQVTLDPLMPAHMWVTMKNIVLLKAAHPEVNINVRIRSVATHNQDLQDATDAAVEFANRFKLPVIETRMRFIRNSSLDLLMLDKGKYKKDGNQFKLKKGELGEQAEQHIVCDEKGKGCPGCMGCARTTTDMRKANLENQSSVIDAEGIGGVSLDESVPVFDPVGGDVQFSRSNLKDVDTSVVFYRGSTADEKTLRISGEIHEHGTYGISTTQNEEYARSHGDFLKKYYSRVPINMVDYFDLTEQYDEEFGEDASMDASPEELTDFAISLGYNGSYLYDPMAGEDFRFFNPDDLISVEEYNAGTSFSRSWYYSPLSKAMDRIFDQKSMTGSQLAKKIESAKKKMADQVKQDEIDAIGLDEYLELNAGTTLTKEDVQAFIDHHGVQIEETTRTDNAGVSEEIVSRIEELQTEVREYRDAAYAEGRTEEDLEEDEDFNDMLLEIEDLESTIDSNGPGQSIGDYGLPKYSDYTLPGGENYREILLTLPGVKQSKAREEFDAFKEEMQQKYLTPQWIQKLTAEEEARRSELAKASAESTDKNFNSNHWDEPNVVAHMRVNTRTVNGEKVLFVEEIQSDWAREGRKKGFDSNVPSEQVKIGAIPGVSFEWNDFMNSGQLSYPVGGGASRVVAMVRDVNGEFHADLFLKPGESIAVGSYKTKDAAEEAIRELIVYKRKSTGDQLVGEYDELSSTPDGFKGQGQIPSAPFVTSSAWQSLVLKRLIRMAAEEGHDRIAWVTGEQTADRYSLDKKLSGISYNVTEDGYNFEAYDLNGNAIFEEEDVDINRIEQLVGKEIASRIERNEGTLNQEYGDIPFYELKGDDLKIEASWARNLYDRAIPKFMQKFGKKYGVGVENINIGMTGLEADSQGSVPDRAAFGIMHSELERMAPDQTSGVQHEIRGYIDGDGYWENFLSAVTKEGTQELKDYVLSFSDPKSLGQQSIKITPEMREDALVHGMPMFGRGDAANVGVQKDDLTKVVGRISQGFGLAKSFEVVATEKDLPQHIVDFISSQSGVGVVEGAFDPRTGKMYLIADAIESIDRAEFVVLHEAGHYGFERLMGKDGKQLLYDIYRANVAESERIGANYGFNMKSAEGRRRAANELIANEFAKRKGRNASLIEKVIARVREWIRSLGLNIKLSDSEISVLVERMAKAIRKDGGIDPNGQPQLAAAWHGTPHRVDRFSTEKIGTGEGNQAYGYGLYFAGNREVGEFYREKLSGRDVVMLDGKPFSGNTLNEQRAVSMLESYYGGVDKSIAQLEMMLKEPDNTPYKDSIQERIDWIEENRGRLSYGKRGNLYQVELAPAEDEYLLWDKPLSEQSVKVKEAIKNILDDIVNREPDYHEASRLSREYSGYIKKNNIDGQGFYNLISKVIGKGGVESRQRAASEYLHSLGIRGVKYLDGMSRGRGEGNYNYVVFNDQDVEITAQFSRRPVIGPASAQKWARGRLDYIRQKLQDKFLVLKRTQENLADDGWQKTDDSDAYLKETLMHGKAELRIEEFEKGHVEPLLKAISDSGIALAELEDYLYALHAPERNAYIQAIDPQRTEGGSGMTDAEAASVLARFNREGKTATLDRLANRVYAMTEMQRQILRDSGLESDERLDAWDQWQNYVPLKGFEDPRDNDFGPTTGSGFNVKGSGTKKTMGRDSRATDLVANVVAQVEQAIVRSEKAEVGRAFLKMVEENPDPELWKIVEPGDGSWPQRKSLEQNPDHAELLKRKRSIERSLRNQNTTAAHRSNLLQLLQTIDQQIAVTPNSIVRMRPDPMFAMADNVLAITREDGSIAYVEIKNPDLARTMKNLNPAMQSKLLQAAAKINRWLSMINTSLNPEFVITNLERDLQTAMINLGGEQSAKVAGTVLKRVPAAMAGIRNALRGDGSSDWANWYDRFRRSGAKVGFMDFTNVEARRKKMQATIKAHNRGPTAQTARKVFNAVTEFIDDYNTAVENAARLATFRTMIENGMSESQAANVAKELTVNFNRKGELGPAMNAAYMFFNAGVQGTARTMQALKSKRVQKTVAAISVMAIGLAQLGRFMGGEDDDGEDMWDKIPATEKETNLIIMNPNGSGDYFKIKLPYGYNAFVALGYAISDGSTYLATGGKKGQSPAEVAGFMFDTGMNAFNPLGGSDSILQTMAPTLADPIVQVAENKAWHGGPVMPPQSGYGPEKPDSQRYWNSARPASVDVAEWLNEITGGDEWEPGVVDISPETFDLWIDFVTGGMGRFVADVGGAAQSLATGDDIPIRRIPFARKGYSEKSEAVDRQNFYQALETIQRRVKAYDDRKAAGDHSGAAEYRRNNPEIRLEAKAKSVKKSLKSLREQRKRYEAHGDNEGMKRLDERIIKKQLEFLREFNERTR